MNKPAISKLPFRDTDISALDEEKDSLFIIGKVFNFGTWEDAKAGIRFYGREYLKKEVVQLADMKKETLSFLCLLLNLTKADFKCYSERQSHTAHWSY